MWHPALDEVECPVTWDGVEALDDEDQRRLLDRVVLCPKTWKRVISKLHLAHSEYCDGQNSKARKLLVEAYAGILEPLGEINQCGASVVYRSVCVVSCSIIKERIRHAHAAPYVRDTFSADHIDHGP